MKLIDELLKLDFLKDNNIEIEENIYRKLSRKLELSLVLDRAISVDDYFKLKTTIEQLITPINLNLCVGYKDEYLEPDDLKGYLKFIVDKLAIADGTYNSVETTNVTIEDNNIVINSITQLNNSSMMLEVIKERFADFGLDVNLEIKFDNALSIEKQIQELDDKMMAKIETLNKEAQEATKFNEEIKKVNKYKQKILPQIKSDISAIPATEFDLSKYQNETGFPTFLINACVFSVEFKTFKNGSSELATINVYDDTDSIMVQKWLRGDNEKQLYHDSIKPGIDLRIIGTAQYDKFKMEVVLTASSLEVLGKHLSEEIVDEEPIKRVELHAHTKMSTLDGTVDAKDYVKTANKWGWSAMAFTDRSGVYAVPDVDHAISSDSPFKPIYGVELPFVDDSKYFITFNDKDINLKEATYVVYDIETTGLSQEFDRMIEISAYKVYQGGIISTFETFVNPERFISEKISELTHITEADVKNAPKADEVIRDFFEFAKGSILVAHNATFDINFIYANAKRLGIPFEEFPAIDTLNLFRALYPTEKKFGLTALAKHYKVKQEQHHRASDDTKVTALCFIQMLQDVFARKVYNYNEIKNLIDPSVFYKCIIPSSIDIICKNPVGFKNMYKILSDALTVHLASDARALRSVIEKYKEGILIGSCTYLGDVFEYAFYRSEADVKEAMSFCDYIEVCPPSGYAHLYDSCPNGKEDIYDVIKKIIRIAKEMGKTVVAVSNSHYLHPSDKKYHDILIDSPLIGGGVHRLKAYDVHPDCHLRTTKEMLDEFDFLDKDLAYEIVVENTNKIADMIEKFPPFKKEMFAPADDEFAGAPLFVPSIEREVERIVAENTKLMYGDNPHPIIKARLEKELNSIISNGYASVYYMSHLMVKKSLDDGYLVGSRGSVGSSFVATMMKITEVNPLAPHYICKKCKFHTISMTAEEEEKYGLTENDLALKHNFVDIDDGYDLPDAICPVCGNRLTKDGHNIPFETFLGFNGDKVPDIDLNFSGEYQGKAHEYIRSVFGYDYAFRGGTVGTIADKNAFGYVKGYCERHNKNFRSCEMDRIASHLVGVKRSTGQHPGGIVVVPHRIDIFDVTPIQYPADDPTNAFRTTHYDYHSFENNLLKLDVLGHDDPTIIKYLMDYVHEHQEEFPFTIPQDIPIDDKNLYRLFSSTDVIGLTEEKLHSKVASYAVPEFGTRFVQQMLVNTLPKTFAQLIKISGLSHGTDVWKNNCEELVAGRTEFGEIPFAKVIGCRDDIMVNLMEFGMEPLDSFKIMEFVRKGKLHGGNPDDLAKWEKFKATMEKTNVPAWYIWSCSKIKYMFPKAHAIAYVMMALRLAWFKVYSPVLFYSAWFSKRASGYDVKAFLGGPIAIQAKIEEISAKPNPTAKDDDLITALQVALEMTLRGIKFLPVDINKSSAKIFEIEDGNLRIPFIAVDKLGETVAETIVEARNESPFKSKEDAQKRGKINQSLFEEFDNTHVFGDLPDKNEEEALGLFAFM